MFEFSVKAWILGRVQGRHDKKRLSLFWLRCVNTYYRVVWSLKEGLDTERQRPRVQTCQQVGQVLQKKGGAWKTEFSVSDVTGQRRLGQHNS